MPNPFYLFPPIGGFGNPSQPWEAPSQFPDIDLNAHKGKAHLLEAQPKDITVGLRFRAYGPNGSFERPSWRARGQKVYIHPATTHGRTSRPEDSPANLVVPGVMTPTLNYVRSLWNGANPMDTSRPTIGVIDLVDNNGRLEYILDYGWDTAPIIIKRGYANALFNTWATVGRFAGASVLGDVDSKKIQLRDLGYKLKVKIHNKFYTGEGGREGDESMKGVWKPYAIGYVFNAEPKLVNAEKHLYQWSFVSSEACSAARHGGSNIIIAADYPTYEALDAAIVGLAIPAGQAATCLAESMIAFNLTVEKSIRVDVQGDNTTRFSHTTPLTRGEIVRRIATCYGDSYLNDGTEIDINAFTVLDQDHAAICGYYFDSETNKDDALTMIMGGILGYFYVTPLGQLTVGYARVPRSTESVADIEYKSYGMGKPIITDELVPRAQTQIGWRQNYGPESVDQLSSGVDPGFAAILGQEARYESAGDNNIVNIYPTAPTVKIIGGFWFQADALAEAQRQDQVMGKVRRRWRWTMEIDAFADIINRVYTITGVNRLKLGASKPLLCVLVQSTGFGTVTTEWWG